MYVINTTLFMNTTITVLDNLNGKKEKIIQKKEPKIRKKCEENIIWI